MANLVQNKRVGLDVFVKDYGAIGDGVTDDSSAIQSAIDAASSTGAAIIFEGKTYFLNKPIHTRVLTHLKGVGTSLAPATTFLIPNQQYGLVIHHGTRTLGEITRFARFENIRFLGQGVLNSTSARAIIAFARFELVNCTFEAVSRGVRQHGQITPLRIARVTTTGKTGNFYSTFTFPGGSGSLLADSRDVDGYVWLEVSAGTLTVGAVLTSQGNTATVSAIDLVATDTSGWYMEACKATGSTNPFEIPSLTSTLYQDSHAGIAVNCIAETCATSFTDASNLGNNYHGCVSKSATTRGFSILNNLTGGKGIVSGCYDIGSVSAPQINAGSVVVGGSWTLPWTSPSGLAAIGMIDNRLFTTQGMGTGISGTGITVNYIGNHMAGKYQVTILNTAWTAAALTQDRTLFTVPAQTQVTRIVARTTVPYAGTGATVYTLRVGHTVGGQEYILDHDVRTAAVNKGLLDADLGTSINRANAVQGGHVPSMTVSTAISARLTSDVNISNITAGTTIFEISVEAV